MPTYEYACNKCGLEFEVFQSMKDAPLKTCNCGKKGKVSRKIGRGAGLIFKGNGFYETDYKRAPESKKPATEGAPAAPKSDTTAKSDSGTKATKTETKSTTADKK